MVILPISLRVELIPHTLVCVSNQRKEHPLPALLCSPRTHIRIAKQTRHEKCLERQYKLYLRTRFPNNSISGTTGSTTLCPPIWKAYTSAILRFAPNQDALDRVFTFETLPLTTLLPSTFSLALFLLTVLTGLNSPTTARASVIVLRPSPFSPSPGNQVTVNISLQHPATLISQAHSALASRSSVRTLYPPSNALPHFSIQNSTTSQTQRRRLCPEGPFYRRLVYGL